MNDLLEDLKDLINDVR